MKRKEHAFLSASSAHRWLNCTPAPSLEAQFEEIMTDAAAEGTAAHALAEHKLKRALKRQTQRPVSNYDTEEMEDCTDDYVNFVFGIVSMLKNEGGKVSVFVEKQVDFSDFVPGGFGTSDCIIVGSGQMFVVDLKYGKGVFVEAKNNPQMMLYAVGALGKYGSKYGIQTVTMVIFQPRRENVSFFEMSARALLEWAECSLKEKAELAFKGMGEYNPGDWCQFCKASVKCRARAESKIELQEYDSKNPALLTDDEIEKVLRASSDLVSWTNSVKAYAENLAVESGKNWNGFKLVQSKTNRKFEDEDAVIKAAFEAGYRDIFKKSLLSVSEMQKLMGEDFSVLKKFVVKPEGHPTLVPESDKRPSINIAIKFKPVKGE